MPQWRFLTLQSLSLRFAARSYIQFNTKGDVLTPLFFYQASNRLHSSTSSGIVILVRLTQLNAQNPVVRRFIAKGRDFKYSMNQATIY